MQAGVLVRDRPASKQAHHWCTGRHDSGDTSRISAGAMLGVWLDTVKATGRRHGKHTTGMLTSTMLVYPWVWWWDTTSVIVGTVSVYRYDNGMPTGMVAGIPLASSRVWCRYTD
jgi:hypothetical protein